jgi:hypothetical protein
MNNKELWNDEGELIGGFEPGIFELEGGTSSSSLGVTSAGVEALPPAMLQTLAATLYMQQNIQQGQIPLQLQQAQQQQLAQPPPCGNLQISSRQTCASAEAMTTSAGGASEPAATQSSKSKRKKQITEQDRLKEAERVRIRNRNQARRARERRKKAADTMQKELPQLERENAVLKAAFRSLHQSHTLTEMLVLANCGEQGAAVVHQVQQQSSHDQALSGDLPYRVPDHMHVPPSNASANANITQSGAGSTLFSMPETKIPALARGVHANTQSALNSTGTIASASIVVSPVVVSAAPAVSPAVVSAAAVSAAAAAVSAAAVSAAAAAVTSGNALSADSDTDTREWHGR